jgi:cobalamin biosynthesis protein CobT
MQRIIGAKLKTAAAVHAQKQMRAMGISWQRGLATVRFSGTRAFIAFDQRGGDPNMLSGWTLNYPALADNAVLMRREADLIACYTMHEVGHAAFTSATESKNRLDRLNATEASNYERTLRQQIWNGIEDARMEQAVMREIPQSRGAFRMLANHLTVAVTPAFNPTKLSAAPFALACIGRAALGNGNAYMRGLLERIPQPKRDLYSRVAERLLTMRLDRDGSAEAWDAADEFVAGWLLIEPAALTVKTVVIAPEGGNPDADWEVQEREIELDSDEDQKHDDTEFDDVEEQPVIRDEQPEQQQSQPQQPWLPSDDDGSDEDDDGEFQDEEEEAQPDIGEGRAADLDGLAPISEPDEEDEAVPPLDPFAEAEDDGNVMPSEPSIDEILIRANDRVLNRIDLPPFQASYRSYLREQKLDVAPASVKATATRLARRVHYPAVTEQIARMLAAPDRFGWDHGAQSGRFDRARQARAAAGSEAVFQRRWESAGINTAVEVIVDLSSSMKSKVWYAMQDPISGEWEKPSLVRVASRVAYLIAKAATRAKASVQVSGFASSRAWTGFYGSAGYDTEGNHHHLPSADSALVVAKAWDDKLDDNAIYRINQLASLANGGTPDYETVATAVQEMAPRREQRKLVLVLTDGCGHVDGMNKLTNSAVELFGVEVIGIGIGIDAWSFKQSYKVGEPVNDISQLGRVTLRKLADWLETTDTRRLS